MIDLRVSVPRREVWCSTAQCGESLGWVGPSSLEAQRGKPVWRIRPGWLFVKGILQKTDYDFRSERLLLHEMTGRERPIVGVTYEREAELPLTIRCPKCHRLQMVVPNNAFRRQEAPGRRF